MSGASSYFLVNERIQGESQNAQYPGSIELLTIGLGIQQPMSATQLSSGSSSSNSRATFKEIVATKYIDKSSPVIYQACASGAQLGDVNFYLVRADNPSPITYLTMTLRNAIISSVDMNGHYGDLPVDTITFGFTAIKWNYIQQGLSGGSKGNTQGFWNIALNRAAF